MRRFWAALLAAAMMLTLAAGGVRPSTENNGKLQVVCTLFPYYDFVRQLGGEDVSPVLLVPAGRETHSFEPTPVDVITMSRADVFIYNGGESETWVEDILDAAGEDIPYRLKMMEQVSQRRHARARAHNRAFRGFPAQDARQRGEYLVLPGHLVVRHPVPPCKNNRSRPFVGSCIDSIVSYHTRTYVRKCPPVSTSPA